MGYADDITDRQAPNDVPTARQIDRTSADLNASVKGRKSLRVWASQSDPPMSRHVERPGLTHVRLADHDEQHAPIVSMLLEHDWERAI